AVETLSNFSKIKGFENVLRKNNNSAYIVSDETNKNLSKSFSNLSNIKFDNVRNINPVDVLSYKHLIIVGAENSLAFLLSKLEGKAAKKAETKSAEIKETKGKAKTVKTKPTKKVAAKKAKTATK
ncbi:MAG: 50S ribosomal protein L4, partial [Candidatus Paceibacterota bacterium]